MLIFRKNSCLQRCSSLRPDCLQGRGAVAAYDSFAAFAAHFWALGASRSLPASLPHHPTRAAICALNHPRLEAGPCFEVLFCTRYAVSYSFLQAGDPWAPSVFLGLARIRI